MNANKDKGISLLHNISLNDKDKLKWTGKFQALQMFVEERLNISDGIGILRNPARPRTRTRTRTRRKSGLGKNPDPDSKKMRIRV